MKEFFMEKELRILTPEELKQTQRICLEMLIEIDRICRKYDIFYSLDGGSLLGAIRHKGFIPWDDDVDIIMHRADYYRFREACKIELDYERFFLQDETTDPAYRFGYAKMRRNNTVQLREGHEHLKDKGGVILDIFYVDNVPDGYVARRIHHFLCFCLRKIQYSVIGSKAAKNPPLRLWYKTLSLIPRMFTFKCLAAIAKVCNRKETELVIHYTYPAYNSCKYGFVAECFKETMDMDFEGYRLKGSKLYDTYLTQLFGDYMELPPEEKRVSHVPYVDLKLIDVELPKI